jgi:hypothetical protein
VKTVIAVAVLVVGLWLASKGAGVALVAAVGVALILGGAARMRTVGGHSHAGDRPLSARHEAGHAAAARALGGRVHSATLNADGTGYVGASIRRGARPAVAFLLAGQYAAGTRRGAQHDEAAIRRELSRVTASERAGVRRAAEQEARRIVSSQSGRIRRDARVLMERGRL